MSILLLYDTKEEDLARDFEEFLEVHNFEVVMIPRAPDLGLPLQQKEDLYIKKAEAAIFLITPGCERNGAQMPSPSVADEMGHVRERFSSTPERVIYLVDKTCKPQAIDQTSYLMFTRGDIRSVLKALTGLVRNLRAAGLVGGTKVKSHEALAKDLAQVVEETPAILRQICIELSKLPSGAAQHAEFTKMLREEIGLSQQQANFAIRDLLLKGLVDGETASSPNVGVFYILSNVGWKLVRSLCV